MRPGDIVIFTDEGRYAKWFYGQLGIAETCNYSKDGKLHCRVNWLQPVKYFNNHTTFSDFPASYFQIYKTIN